MDTIKNSVSQSAKALLLVNDGRGALGHCGERLNLTFPKIVIFDPLAGLCQLAGLYFFFKDMCSCIFAHMHVLMCVSMVWCVHVCRCT